MDAKVKEILPYFPRLQGSPDPAVVQALLDLGQAAEKAHADDPKAWSLSGDLFYHANRPDEALERYRRCLKLEPTVFAVWDNALTILADRAQWDELLQTAEKALDAFPNHARVYYFYGLAAVEKGRPDDALSMLEQALLMTGNQTGLRLDIVDQLGRALLARKDASGAIACYEKALPAGGDQHPGLLEHYGDALFQAGQREKAIQFWQKALDLRKSPALEQKISTGKL
jgi:tetratricopeptide (TPR) repeat protein